MTNDPARVLPGVQIMNFLWPWNQNRRVQSQEEAQGPLKGALCSLEAGPRSRGLWAESVYVAVSYTPGNLGINTQAPELSRHKRKVFVSS